MRWHKQINPAGWLYGAIVTGALFTLAAAHPADYPRLLGIVLATLVMYWLSHVYVRVIADRLSDPTASFASRLRESLHHERSVLWGGLPAVLAYLVFLLLGWTDQAPDAALWTTVALLGVVGYRTGIEVGATGGKLVLEVIGCSFFGIALIGLKVVLH